MASGRGVAQSIMIWVARQVVERAAEYRIPVMMCFVDLTKAYDSVDRSALMAVLKSTCGHHSGALLWDLVSGQNNGWHV